MRSVLPLGLLALAACGTGENEGGNGAASKARAAAVQTATLTGLYESGEGARPDQLCILDRGAGNASFGLVLRGGCGGVGDAVRSGSVLRLTMRGDEDCVIEAATDGQSVAFPARLPAGCAYYCAPGARLAGVRFAKTGGEAADAMRAEDLVGDPLCG